MKILIGFLFFLVPVLAQTADCGPINSGPITTAVTNRVVGYVDIRASTAGSPPVCQNFQMKVGESSFASVSVTLQISTGEAACASASYSTWTPVTGSSNPLTAGGSAFFNVGTADVACVRMLITTTGTGSLGAQFFGYRFGWTASAASGPGAGGCAVGTFSDGSVVFIDPAATCAQDAGKFDYIKTALTSPLGPTVTPHCTIAGMEMCNSTYIYQLVARSLVGTTAGSDTTQQPLAGTFTTITNGPNTLTVANFNTITIGTCQNGQSSWDLYVSPNVGFSNTYGYLANISCGITSYNDTNESALDSAFSPVLNTTSGLYTANSLRFLGSLLIGAGLNNSAPNYEPSAGDGTSSLNRVEIYDTFSDSSLNYSNSGQYRGVDIRLLNTSSAVSLTNQPFHTHFVNQGNTQNDVGFLAEAENDSGTLINHAGFYSAGFVFGGSLAVWRDVWGRGLVGGGTAGEYFGFFADASSNFSSGKSFPIWLDDQGVYVVHAINTFNSVYQDRPALYNPQFTKFTPGAADFERCIPGCQWESNEAWDRTEAGGTGTLRRQGFGSAGFDFSVPAATALPMTMTKVTASAAAPGAGTTDLRWVAGTNAGTCKLVGNAGTSATEVTIVDNVGSGC